MTVGAVKSCPTPPSNSAQARLIQALRALGDAKRAEQEKAEIALGALARSAAEDGRRDQKDARRSRAA